MKKFYNTYLNETVYVGNAREIKPIYNSMYKHQTENLFTVFCEKARFNPVNFYGLIVTENGGFSVMGMNALTKAFILGDLVEA